jgi:Domain of unknown function (DUF3291)
VHQLAQVNVARMRAPLRSAAMGGFAAALDPVNRLADESPGFVWRYRSPDGHAAITRPDGRPDGAQLLVVNLSVWASYEALHAFVYRSAHGGFVRGRARWFLPTPQPSTALWWVAEGTRPSLDEALRRLALLRAEGPSPRAFTLRRRFTPDGRPVLPRRRVQ